MTRRELKYNIRKKIWAFFTVINPKICPYQKLSYVFAQETILASSSNMLVPTKLNLAHKRLLIHYLLISLAITKYTYNFYMLQTH